MTMKKQHEIMPFLWSGLVPAMLAVLENPDADEDAKQTIRQEFHRMAEFIDKINASNRAEG